MSSNLTEIAKAYSKAGYSVIPVGTNKVPTIREWKQFQSRPMTEKECETHFKNSYGIALLCGTEKNITTVDIDLKYDLSGTLYERLKAKIPKDILKKMYVQSTVSGGYHFAFSCPKIEGNQKLASRYTTSYEQHKTYIENFENPSTRERAIKVAFNDKTKVLIETRGEGGFICINPTPGYKKIYGKISEITEEEYDILLSITRTFNETREIKTDIKQQRYDDWKISPFEDYNAIGDVLSVLSANGWDTVGRQHGRSIRLKRPGQVHSNSSALFDTDRRILNVFSTSTSFDVNKGYTASDIFIHLECNGDVKLGFSRLVEMGYGKK